MLTPDHQTERREPAPQMITCGVAMLVRALIIDPPTPFSPEASDPLQNMALRANTHIDRAVLGGFMIKALVTVATLLRRQLLAPVGRR